MGNGVLLDALDKIADLAMWLEDEPEMKLGRAYSVNINFRREGNRLFVSLESYGGEHRGKSQEYSVKDLKRTNRNKKIKAGVGIAAGLAVAVGVIALVK